MATPRRPLPSSAAAPQILTRCLLPRRRWFCSPDLDRGASFPVGGGAASQILVVAPASVPPVGAGRFVKSWCARTEYPLLCEAMLAPYAAEVGSSPTRMARAALAVALGGARNTTAAMREMAAAGHLAAEAARDRVSMLRDAVGLLRQSVDAMARLTAEEQQQPTGGAGSSDRDAMLQVESVQEWASAALTDDEMCMEGFRAEAAGGGAREGGRAATSSALRTSLPMRSATCCGWSADVAEEDAEEAGGEVHVLDDGAHDGLQLRAGVSRRRSGTSPWRWCCCSLLVTRGRAGVDAGEQEEQQKHTMVPHLEDVTSI